jgi:YidC/Oxa1 family membrane protein insertase
MSLLDPLSHVLAAVVAAAHAALTSLGADPAAGTTWLLCIAAVVVAVRLALLPFVVHGVRLAHASARARPQLQDLAAKYRDRRDPDSLREMLAERRAITAEHGMPRLGCLPMVLQLPVWFALYHLLSSVASGVPVGAMHSGLVASMSTATLLGVPLASRGYLGAGPAHLAAVAVLAVLAAGLAYATQHLAAASSPMTGDVPEAMAQVQRLMPMLSAVGILVAGSTVLVGLLAYWVCNSAWTLAQTAVITRWFPTPSPS